jgi:prolyl 4-hydroxylase
VFFVCFFFVFVCPLFFRAGKLPHPKNLTGCHDNGLQVKPEKGKVIIFYNMLPSGEVDPYSLHAACPVKHGTKWAANKWVWNAPSQFAEVF